MVLHACRHHSVRVVLTRGELITPQTSLCLLVHACATSWIAPRGWLECAGAAVNKQTYPQLYAVIGATYAETATTFTLPTIAQLSVNLRYVVKY